MNVVVCGLGYGDEGKGTIVDALCGQQSVSATVRFNGGPQAGHRVVMVDGRDHVFSQWGSGTFRDIPTFHSRFSALDPMSSTTEADHLVSMGVSKPYSLLVVDPDCLIITPYHKRRGQRTETARGYQQHGSCGMGHGAAVEHSLRHPDQALRVRDIFDGTAYAKLVGGAIDGEDSPREILDCYELWASLITVATPRRLALLAEAGDLIFEGAQGVLLDEWHGFHPYTTWSTCTFENAMTLLDELGETAMKLGVLRAFSTRHGPGPFVSEINGCTWRPDWEYNNFNGWQGNFRIGYFDAVAARYACTVATPDALAVTHLDNGDRYDLYVERYWNRRGTEVFLTSPADVRDLKARTAFTYDLKQALPQLTPRRRRWVETIEDLIDIPIAIESWGPTAGSKNIRWNVGSQATTTSGITAS
jgi:adenylosuccinate synthase